MIITIVFLFNYSLPLAIQCTILFDCVTQIKDALTHAIDLWTVWRGGLSDYRFYFLNQFDLV